MVAWRQNKTLFPAIFEAARKADAPLRTRMRMRTLFAFASDDDLRELEKELTVEATKAGVIKPTGDNVVEGCYVGEWGDGHILQWIIDNWDSILKMILSIIALFQVAPTIGVLIFCAALLLGSTASAQCAGGVCQVPERAAIIRHREVTVERTIVADRVVQPVRRLIHRDRFLLYRRVLIRHGGM